MKVLWIINIELPAIENIFGRHTVIGGWLDQTSRQLADTADVELAVACPSNDEYFGEAIDGIRFFSFMFCEKCVQKFTRILNNYCPDIVHIWGTEHVHSLTAIMAAEQAQLIKSTVVSIQGLVSIYAFHYCEGIPNSIIHHRTLKEWLGRPNIMDACNQMKDTGKYEKEVIYKAQNVIGRTDWDLACIKQLNPKAKYYHCNETLRKEFYQKRWTVNRCQRKTIFFSQYHYPVKGIHNLLNALPLLVRKYPDMHVYVVGDNLLDTQKGIRAYKHSSYEWYLLELINKNNLDKYFTFLGKLDASQMVEYYCKANVFVCSSNIENSSNSVGEAMLIGTPVVASDVGGIKSLLTHEKEGLIYQNSAYYMLADCIDRIWSDDFLAERLSTNARNRAYKTHNADCNLRTLLNIYEELRLKGI